MQKKTFQQNTQKDFRGQFLKQDFELTGKVCAYEHK
jgi:hypothetical protein